MFKKRFLSFLLTIVMAVTSITSVGITGFAASEEDIATFSIQPIPEVKAYLVLDGYSNEDLQTMPVDKMLNMLVDSNGQKVPVKESATTVWRFCKDDTDGIDEYQKFSIGQNQTIDLSAASGVKAYNLELIIGSEKQLDSENIRYLIKVYVSENVGDKLSYELYLQNSDGMRTQVDPKRKVSPINNQTDFPITTNEYVVPAPEDGSQYYLGIKSVASEHPNIRVEVYDFLSYLISGGDTDNLTPITDKILNQNMESEDSGISITYDNGIVMLAFVYYKNDIYDRMSFGSFAAVSDSSYIDCSLYLKNDDTFIDTVLLNVDHIGFDDIESVFDSNGVHEFCLMLKEKYTLDSELYCVLNAHGKTYGDEANIHVTKAVEGHYNNIEDASSCEDIREQLIPENQSSTSRGYKANYDYRDGGVPFTVFFEDGSVWKIRVLAMEYDPKYDENYLKSFTDRPIIGEADPWFRITGAKQGDSVLDTYVVENGKSINMDTYYGYGYQTVFINDKDVDLSRLKPICEVADKTRVKVFAAGKDEGKPADDPDDLPVRDFSKGMLEYSNLIDNHEKNYMVQFVKKETGPKLFVNGPSERSVFLDEYFEYKHDILIANVGDQSLENLRVELNATHVKLDDYWTVSEAGNNTLAAFETTSVNSQYGELANLAKIRLLPDGEGEIKGTLTISADNCEPVIIELFGLAKNPTIVTEELEPAVRFVPYSYKIASDNMHDWNEVTYSIESGELPEGIDIKRFEETGEIYGAPTEARKFEFRIKASYSCEDFEPSYADFTLIVNDNTNENVYNATNEKYEVKQFIGTRQLTDGEETPGDDFILYDEDVETSQVFSSVGNFAQFEACWLDGKKLEEGKDKDYIARFGSSVMTIFSQTLKALEVNKRHTIAIEFRDGKNVLQNTSQNIIRKSSNKPDPDPEPDPDPDPKPEPDDPDSAPDDPDSAPDDPDSSPDTSTSTPDTSTSSPDTSGGTSTPSESDVVFKPLPVSGDMADIINGITVFAPSGVMSKDAVLIVKPDGGISADKGTALDFTFTLDGKSVQPNGSMTVRIPIPANLKGVTPLYVYHVANGRYDLVDSWIDGDYVCFKANGFSTYIVSGKRLDENGNEIADNAPGTSKNPVTGIGISAIGLLVSGSALTVILLNRKRKLY